MISVPVSDAARAMGADARGGDTAVICRVVTDSRAVEAGDLFVAVRGANHDGHAFVGEAFRRGAAACLVDRRWALASNGKLTPGRDGAGGLPDGAGRLLIVDDTVGALQRMAAWYRREVMDRRTRVVAITGSNGKTTTKQMIDHVLRGSLAGKASPKSFNNHLGVPLTLLSADAGDEYLVVEIGTNVRGEIAALAALCEADLGVITSIGAAHLAGLGDLQGVAAEKASLLGQLKPDAVALVPGDVPVLDPHLSIAGGRALVKFGTGPAVERRYRILHADLHGTRLLLDEVHEIEVNTPGVHHAGNAVAAFLVAERFALSAESIIERLASFRPSGGRTRLLACQGLTIIDDTYNANPGSMMAAVDTLRRASTRRVLVMGDMFELGDQGERLHRDVLAAAIQAGIEQVVAVGAIFTAAARRLATFGLDERLVCCADTAAAVERLPGLLKPGDTVWLKGSRLMALEQIVRRLTEHDPMAAPVAP